MRLGVFWLGLRLNGLMPVRSQFFRIRWCPLAALLWKGVFLQRCSWGLNGCQRKAFYGSCRGCAVGCLG